MIEKCPFCKTDPQFISDEFGAFFFGCLSCDKGIGNPMGDKEGLIKYWNETVKENHFIEGEFEVVKEQKLLEVNNES